MLGRKIVRNLLDIKERVSIVIDPITDLLIENEIVQLTIKQEMDAMRGPGAKVDHLIQIVKSQGDNACEVFLEGLTNNGLDDLVRKIRGTTLTSWHEEMPNDHQRSKEERLDELEKEIKLQKQEFKKDLQLQNEAFKEGLRIQKEEFKNVLQLQKEEHTTSTGDLREENDMLGRKYKELCIMLKTLEKELGVVLKTLEEELTTLKIETEEYLNDKEKQIDGLKIQLNEERCKVDLLSKENDIKKKERRDKK